MVEVRRVGFAGHVYSLDSSEGWHVANGLIVSNCDCTYQLVRRGEDWGAPEEIPLDEIRGLSQADRQAIELGADRSAVINARRGMQSVTSYGQKAKATSEGMTAHGDAYKRLVRDRAERLGLTESQIAGRVDRLRPESILGQARDQEDAVRLLRLHGYIK